jgi:tetratricopeptide (TPR) repeat protein
MIPKLTTDPLKQKMDSLRGHISTDEKARRERVFVGQDREAVLDRLMNDWERCRAEGSTTMVVLEGPSGSGKTRIVQELYRRLADGQDQVYWPPDALSPASTKPLADSGLIVPKRLNPGPGVDLPYAWVPVSCQILGDERQRALIPASLISGEIDEPVGRRTGQAMRALLDLGILAFGVICAAAAVPQLASLLGISRWVSVALALFGLGLTVLALKGLRTPLGELSAARRSRRRRVRGGVIDPYAPWRDASATARDRVRDIIDASTVRDLPSVVVVDDAQWADDDTVALLDELLRVGCSPKQSIPVLVVATARPDVLVDQVQRAEAGREMGSRYRQDLRTEFGSLLVDGRHTNIRPEKLGLLDTSALGLIVTSRASRTSPQVVAALSSRAQGNPFLLGVLLELDWVERSLKRDRYDIADPEAALLSVDLGYSAVFEQRWERLGEGVRRVVALGTLQGTFVQSDALRVAYSAIFGDDAATDIAAARDAHFWLETVEPCLDRYADPRLYDVARHHLGQVANPDELNRARRSMLSDLQRRRRDQSDWETFSPRTRRTLLETHVRAIREGHLDADLDGASSSLELAHLTDGPREALVSAGYAMEAVAWGKIAPELVDEARAVAASRYIQCGRADKARGLAKQALAYCASRLGLTHPRTLAARHQLAVALLLLNRFEEARSILEPSLTSREVTSTLKKSDLFLLRSDLAHALKGLSLYNDALAFYKTLLADREQLLGGDHPDSLSTRNDLAHTLSDLGDTDTAIQMYRTLIVSQQHVLRQDDPNALLTRRNLATTLGTVGRQDEACSVLEELLQDCHELLGFDHPGTLAVAHDLAGTLIDPLYASTFHDARLAETHIEGLDAGRIEEARNRFDEVLRSRQRVLGPNHPETLETRIAIAYLDWTFGPGDGVAVYDQLLEDCQNALGADHPLTMQTTRRLIVAMNMAGPKYVTGQAEKTADSQRVLLGALDAARQRFERAPSVMLPNLLELLGTLALDQEDQPFAVLETGREGLRAYCRVYGNPPTSLRLRGHTTVPVLAYYHVRTLSSPDTRLAKAAAYLCADLELPLERPKLHSLRLRAHRCIELLPDSSKLGSLLFSLRHALGRLDWLEATRAWCERELGSLLGKDVLDPGVQTWLGHVYAILEPCYRDLGLSDLARRADAAAKAFGYTNLSTYDEFVALTTEGLPSAQLANAPLIDGHRYFIGVQARELDLLNMERAEPGVLNGSRWLHCDLDGTRWPAAIQDVAIVDSLLRDSRWDLECGEDIRILGTREFRIWMEDESDATVEADLARVLTRVDRMQWDGRATGVTLHQVAGKDVCFGEVDDGFWRPVIEHPFDPMQIQMPEADTRGSYFGSAVIEFTGNPIQMHTVTIRGSYLEYFMLYMVAHDIDVSHNGVPDMRLGGEGYRAELTSNLSPETSSDP